GCDSMKCVADRTIIKKAFLVLELIIRQRFFRTDETIRDGVAARFCIAGKGMWVVSQGMINKFTLLLRDPMISSSLVPSSPSNSLSDIREILLCNSSCLQRDTPLFEIRGQPRCLEFRVSIVHLRPHPSGGSDPLIHRSKGQA